MRKSEILEFCTPSPLNRDVIYEQPPKETTFSKNWNGFSMEIHHKTFSICGTRRLSLGIDALLATKKSFDYFMKYSSKKVSDASKLYKLLSFSENHTISLKFFKISCMISLKSCVVEKINQKYFLQKTGKL